MVKNVSPGPKYDAPTTVGYERADPRIIRAPAYSLGQALRSGIPSGSRVPGPKYDVTNLTRYGRASNTGGASLASRIVEPTTRTPGPATYNTVLCMPVIKPAMPMYSMG